MMDAVGCRPQIPNCFASRRGPRRAEPARSGITSGQAQFDTQKNGNPGRAMELPGLVPPPNRKKPRRFSTDRRRWVVASAGLAAGLVTGPLRAQAGFPSKQVKIIVAFPPGGLTDSYARMYAEQLTTRLGGTALVENKPDAGGILAIDAVATSPPDAHTLLMTTSRTVWQNRVLYSKLPYNLDRDLLPIAFFPSGPLIIGVGEKVPAKTLKEFIEWARQNPCSTGTYAPGSVPHMVADQLNRSEGTKIQAVHYRGESPMWVDLASGQIQIAVGSYQSFQRPVAGCRTTRMRCSTPSSCMFHCPR